MLQHFSRWQLGNRLYLIVVLYGMRHIGDIAESTHEIEVAQTAECQHLSPHHLVVTFGELWVYGHHVRGMIQYDVTIINHLVQTCPRAIAHRGQQINRVDIVEG